MVTALLREQPYTLFSVRICSANSIGKDGAHRGCSSGLGWIPCVTFLTINFILNRWENANISILLMIRTDASVLVPAGGAQIGTERVRRVIHGPAESYQTRKAWEQIN